MLYPPSTVTAFGTLGYCSFLNTDSLIEPVVMLQEGPDKISPFILVLLEIQSFIKAFSQHYTLTSLTELKRWPLFSQILPSQLRLLESLRSGAPNTWHRATTTSHSPGHFLTCAASLLRDQEVVVYLKGFHLLLTDHRFGAWEAQHLPYSSE